MELTRTRRDFDAPLSPLRPADSSAQTIAATALLMLSRLEAGLHPPNITGAKLWSTFAIQVTTISKGLLL